MARSIGAFAHAVGNTIARRLGDRLHEERDDQAVIAIMFAIMATTLFVVAAFVVDLGALRDRVSQAQNTADAAALAAGNALWPAPDVVTPQYAAGTAMAESISAANWNVPTSAWASCTDPAHLPITAGNTTCISYSVTGQYTHIRVVVPTKISSTGLGGVGGTGDQGNHQVQRVAGASIWSGGGAGCGVCIVGGGTHSLQNGNVSATNGGIAVNGTISGGPNGSFSSTGTNNSIVLQNPPTGGTSFSPQPASTSTYSPDPLADLAQPPTTTPAALTVHTNPCTQGPGVYGSFSISGTCNLTPGTYVIAGGASTAWTLSGGAVLNGSEVTLYLTCGTPAAPTACNNQGGAYLNLSGSGTVNLSAPTSGSLYGMVVESDRGNTSTTSMAGNGGIHLNGTVYLVGQTLAMNGNGCQQSFSALFIIGDLSFAGNGSCLSTNYVPTSNAQHQSKDLHLEY